eukprot:TRINITY_DN10246_c0_g1_i1.p1 TRINITY_DN10246_c0_g1~~TRINITY_DN10246_c0_g1_i1.p1  ORF type:complete len:533 (+),score=80.47 TRINITY_DN10246_c0_g1_i1:147-1745(+)
MALEGSFRGSDPLWDFIADNTTDFNDRGFGPEASEFRPNDHLTFAGTKLCMDGDWYHGKDDVVKGLRLGPSIPIESDAGQQSGFMACGLTSSIGSGMDMIDNTQLSRLTETSFGCADVSSPNAIEGQKQEPDSARFDKSHAAPVKFEDSLFLDDAATSIHLRGASPCEAANCVLDNLRGREWVAILKINPKKFSIKAVACCSMGLSCEFKVYVYDASGFDLSEQLSNVDVKSSQVATLEFQRRSGDCVAFAKIIEAVQADLIPSVRGHMFAGIGDSPRTCSDDRVPRHASSPLPQTIGSTIAGKPLVVSINTAVDAAAMVAASNDIDRSVGFAGSISCIESSEDVSLEPFAPLFDCMSLQHVHDREALAELASGLQTAAEGDPHSIARLCDASISTCGTLAHLLTASAFSIVYPTACALAAIAQCTEAAFLLVECAIGTQFPRLATLILERLEDLAVESVVKRQLALFLCRFSRRCSSWLVGDGVIHHMVMALQRLLIAPTLEAEIHVQTRSWLTEALATLTIGKLESSEGI